mmetsp:Transcript_7440/g.12831  ORF Transcript_7440/g.12831 Transcript_7440/m.12831 type:complete len:227 (+) Transcript_7440:41-721(+)
MFQKLTQSAVASMVLAVLARLLAPSGAAQAHESRRAAIKKSGQSGPLLTGAALGFFAVKALAHECLNQRHKVADGHAKKQQPAKARAARPSQVARMILHLQPALGGEDGAPGRHDQRAADVALPQLEREEQRQQHQQLARGAARLPGDHVHLRVLAQRDARVHPPPLVSVLEHHDEALRDAPLQEDLGESVHARAVHREREHGEHQPDGVVVVLDPPGVELRPVGA